MMMRIGELARRTGLTIRMLRHYDEIGLCSPRARSAAGYRLYSAEDVRRLQTVVSLRHLGFSLGEIGRWLDRPDTSVAAVLDLHISRLGERIEAEVRLRSRLQALRTRLSDAGEVSADEFIQTIEAITMFEKYYTPEQLEELKQRAEALGEEGMRNAQNDWTELGAAVRAEMESGTDPSDEKVQALARRWSDLIARFTGGNAGIEKSLGKLWKEERPALAERYGTGGFDLEMAEYIGRARAAADSPD